MIRTIIALVAASATISLIYLLKTRNRFGRKVTAPKAMDLRSLS